LEDCNVKVKIIPWGSNTALYEYENRNMWIRNDSATMSWWGLNTESQAVMEFTGAT
jgi:hypothetical protein